MGPEIRASAAVGRRRPRAARRGSVAAVLTLAAAVAVTPACALNQEGVQPPRNEIFFPGGALVDGSGQWLYVTNSNSDLRYNNGTMVVVNLDAARRDREQGATSGWSSCPAVNYIRPAGAPSTTPLCCWDVLDRHALNCDSRQYIDPAGSVRLGSFAGSMVFHADPGCTEGDGTACSGRLFVAVRGNSSITHVESTIEGGSRRLNCNMAAGAGTFGECDADHRITQRPVGPDDPSPLPDAAKVVLPEEPYALALDPPFRRLMVGHLRGGTVSLTDISITPPRLIGYYGAIVPADSNGLRGITSMIRRADGHFFVGSRFVPRVAGVVTTGQGNTQSGEALDNIAVVGSGEQYVSNLPGTETRGIQFIDPIADDPAPQPRLAYVLQRLPPVLLKFEDANQLPVDVVETCNSPTFLDQHGTGINARLYVTCFEDGEVYVVDPRVPRVVDIVEVGRGPAGLAFPPAGAEGNGKLMYVVGFGANNVSVVDIEPGSETENHVIQRIGFPSAVPR